MHGTCRLEASKAFLILLTYIAAMPFDVAAAEAGNAQNALSAGYAHSLALLKDGTIRAWGNNEFGQLGNGTTTNQLTPVKVLDWTNVAAVSCGGAHSLALLKNGAVWAWGNNEFGQLGNGTMTNQLTPVRVLDWTNVAAVSCGEAHSLALLKDGAVWAWGNNESGQLGNGTTTDSWTPVQVKDLRNVTAVSCGYRHSMALREDGTVWAWGDNEWGQLGDGSTSGSWTPVEVKGLAGVTAVSSGGGHNLALLADGAVWAWGLNDSGQLGNTSEIESSNPARIRGLTNATAINSSVPVRVQGVRNVAAISAGGSHSLVLLEDGSVWAWGDNQHGQLGDGSTTNWSVAVQVEKGTLTIAVSAGCYHSMALRSDGTVRTWGWNAYGQLGDGSTLERLLAVVVKDLTNVGVPTQSSDPSSPGNSDQSAWSPDITVSCPADPPYRGFEFVTAIGDVDGDDLGDILAASNAWNADGTWNLAPGKAFVFSGRDGHLLRTIDSPDTTWYGDGKYQGYDAFVTGARLPSFGTTTQGWVLIAAGNTDDHAGLVYILDAANAELKGTVQEKDWPEQGYSDFGASVAGLEPLLAKYAGSNEPGDFAVGFPSHSVWRDMSDVPEIGGVFIYSHHGALLKELVSPHFGTYKSRYFGEKVSSVPSFGLDGPSGIAVTENPWYVGGGLTPEAWEPFPADYKRPVYVFDTSYNLSHELYCPDEEFDKYFGTSLAGLHDLDGRRSGSVAVGAVINDPSYIPDVFRGRIYVFSGTVLLHRIDPPPGAEHLCFGIDVTGVGDIDGDGIEDLSVNSGKFFFSGATGKQIPTFSFVWTLPQGDLYHGDTLGLSRIATYANSSLPLLSYRVPVSTWGFASKGCTLSLDETVVLFHLNRATTAVPSVVSAHQRLPTTSTR